MVIETQNARPTLPAAPVQDLTEQPAPEAADTALERGQGQSKTLFGLTPLAAAFRFISPSWRNYIMYVDMEARTGNVEAQHYLRTWQALTPKERQTHVPEQICELSQVVPADLVGWVTKRVWDENTAATGMVLSFNRPRVLERTAQFAMESPENGRHADLFLKAAGVMPQPSRGAVGHTFNLMPVASSGSVALAGSKSDSSPVSVTGLRDMDQEIVELSRIMQRDDAVVPLSAAETLSGDEEQDNDDDDRDEDDE